MDLDMTGNTINAYDMHNAKLIQKIYHFIAFINTRDKALRTLDFKADNFYFANENYKAKTAEDARKALQYENWTEEWIDDGRILDCVRKAVKCDENLIYPIQKTTLLHKIDPDHKDYNPHAARVLYDIYKSESRDVDAFALTGTVGAGAVENDAEGADAEESAFNEAVGVFGRYYDIISYLFFIKDPKRFLPVSPGNFERSLDSVGIKYELSGQCSWENYQGFIKRVRYIRDEMKNVLRTVDIRLIDAHTFLWVLHEDREGKKDKQYSEFLNWIPDAETATWIEEEAEGYLLRKATGIGGRRNSSSPGFKHSAEVVRITRERAKGICQLCGQPAPFKDKKGEPYLEAHHVMWLSRGGEDSTDNTVALCPNCHAKMHVVDDPGDVEKLRKELRG